MGPLVFLFLIMYYVPRLKKKYQDEAESKS